MKKTTLGMLILWLVFAFFSAAYFLLEDKLQVHFPREIKVEKTGALFNFVFGKSFFNLINFL